MKNLYNTFKEPGLFVVAGVLGYLADVLITTGLHALIGPYLARIPAFLGAATVTWLFNRHFTFSKAEKRHQSIRKEYLHYLGLMLFGLIANYIVYAISVALIGSDGLKLLVSVAFGSLAGMVVNYFNSKKHLYRTKKDV